jgi:thiamine biosynthesis lipoprotein
MRPHLGTFVEIAAEGEAAAAMETAIEAAFAAVETVHRLMSFHEPASDVSRLNRGAFEAPVRVHPWTFHVLETALELHRRSNGSFDIRIAPFLQKLGLLPRHYGNSFAVAATSLGRGGIELLSGYRVRYQDSACTIDLGGIAKGFAADRAIDALHAHGMVSGLVNAGGDLAAFGPRSVPVSIIGPTCRDKVLAQAYLCNGALASSGPAFDPFGSMEAAVSAIIDPVAGRPPAKLIGATVRAPCCLLADALTKIVMIGGESSLPVLRHFGASALAVSAEGEIYATPEWENGAVLAA